MEIFCRNYIPIEIFRSIFDQYQTSDRARGIGVGYARHRHAEPRRVASLVPEPNETLTAACSSPPASRYRHLGPIAINTHPSSPVTQARIGPTGLPSRACDRLHIPPAVRRQSSGSQFTGWFQSCGRVGQPAYTIRLDLSPKEVDETIHARSPMDLCDWRSPDASHRSSAYRGQHDGSTMDEPSPLACPCCRVRRRRRRRDHPEEDALVKCLGAPRGLPPAPAPNDVCQAGTGGAGAPPEPSDRSKPETGLPILTWRAGPMAHGQ